MPSVPPFASGEKFADHKAVYPPVGWREERVRSGNGVEVVLAVGRVEARNRRGWVVGDGGEGE